jgi:hypothetical protein
MTKSLDDGTNDDRPPCTPESRRARAIQSLIFVVLVVLALYELSELPICQQDANSTFARAKEITAGPDFAFLWQEEGLAKARVDVRRPSRYLLLPPTFGSPAAAAFIGGQHFLLVKPQLLQLAAHEPDIAAGIIAHEVGHEWESEHRGKFAFFLKHGIAIAMLSIAILACYWLIGRMLAVAVLAGSLCVSVALICIFPVIADLTCTSLEAAVGAFISVLLVGFLADTSTVGLRARCWLAVSLVAVSAFLLLGFVKPRDDRRREAAADGVALRVLVASGRADAARRMLCWLEALHPTATENWLTSQMSDHPGNEERLIALGVAKGLRACSDGDAERPHSPHASP